MAQPSLMMAKVPLKNSILMFTVAKKKARGQISPNNKVDWLICSPLLSTGQMYQGEN